MIVPWWRLILALGGGVLLVLSACGLEPRYAQLPPERDDGTFRWIDVAEAPPPDYLPVIFADPETRQELAVCRSFIVDDPEPEQGYHVGELGDNAAGAGVCSVPHRGDVFHFHESDNGYQQLWVRQDARYGWLDYDDLPKRLSARTAVWESNNVPGSHFRRSDTGEPLNFWMPCAAQSEGQWHLGKVGMHNWSFIPCFIQRDERELPVYDGVRILYAPVP